MAELLKDLTCEGFAAITASDAPAPGGGSASALAGALGAALAGMVANLTIGKKKYEEVQDEMKELAAQGEALQKELIADRMPSACRRIPRSRRLPERQRCRKA